MRWDQSPFYQREIDRLARATGLSRNALRTSSLPEAIDARDQARLDQFQCYDL